MPRNYNPSYWSRRASVPTVTKAIPRAGPRKAGLAIVPVPNAPQAKKDVRLYRAWADQNEWIRAAINHRKSQVNSAPHDIVPIDAQKSFDTQAQLRMVNLFDNPNPMTDSFRILIEKIIEDLMVLDSGCVEIVRNVGGEPAQLWNVDGAWIRVSPIWQGDPKEPRYYWYPNGQFSTALLDQDMMYMLQNPSTHRVLGLSPLETLRETIDAEMAAARFNKAQVYQAPPQGIINLGEDATIENIDQFEKYWRAEIAGVKTTAVIGGTKNPEFIPFGRSQRDMQYLQWQSYLIRKIAAVYAMSPQDLGILFDVNRANADTQADLSEDRGLRPLIVLLENHFNREVIGSFQRQRAKKLYFGGAITHENMKLATALTYLDARTDSRMAIFKQNQDANLLNLQFRFKIPSGRNVAARAMTHKMELAGMPWLTINRVRDEELEDPIEGGDEIIVPTPLGPVRLSAIIGAQLASPMETKILDALIANAPIILQKFNETPKVPEPEELVLD